MWCNETLPLFTKANDIITVAKAITIKTNAKTTKYICKTTVARIITAVSDAKNIVAKEIIIVSVTIITIARLNIIGAGSTTIADYTKTTNNGMGIKKAECTFLYDSARL